MNKSGCILMLVSSLAMTVHGQLFSPESLTGAFLGAFIGGAVGGDCHHGFSGEGAAIGAGVGFLAGTLAGHANRRSEPYVYSAAAPVPQPGYGYVYSDAAILAPAPRPNYAVSGTLAGAGLGGVIGATHNRGWEGAGIGAASGLVIGSVAEGATRSREQKERKAAVAVKPAPVQGRAAPPDPERTQTSVVWQRTAPRARQIPDAPRIPDAPTF